MRKVLTATAVVALSLSAGSAIADPPPRALPNFFLKFTVDTGDDDLRGGRDNVFAAVVVNGATGRRWMLNQRGQRWADRTRHQTTIPLPAGTRPNQIQKAVLTTTFRGGIDGDNWNMSSVTVELTDDTRSFHVVLGRSGPKRFTGSDQRLEVPLALPISRDSIEKNPSANQD